MKKTIFIFIFLIAVKLYAQTGSVEGFVYDKSNNEPLPFSNILILGTQLGTTSDLDGKFIISGINPGFINMQVSCLGYQTSTIEIKIINSKESAVDIYLQKSVETLAEVTVTTNKFEKKTENIASVRSLELSEIDNSPGANRDISKVLQILPGIAAIPGQNRNDIIVRGGGASESQFYLDDVEIPIINHFATQGSSGGSVGIINADFIRKVDFFSGGFPSSKGNALSGIFDFKQIDGNNEKQQFRGSLGASEVSITADGPINKNSTYIFSVRRSYLQFLFKALGLPFLPIFNDYQFKLRYRINQKNEIKIISIGALDNSILDTKIENPDEFQRYVLGYLPYYSQWTYTIGGVYKHYQPNGVQSLILSRNMFNYRTYKYKNNDNSNEANKILDYISRETENKLRYEASYEKNVNLNYGLNLEHANYTNNTYNIIDLNSITDTINYNSSLEIFKYGLFGQISKSFFNSRLNTSFGFRFDGSNYSSSLSNLFEQFSPRISLSYALTEKLNVLINSGRYFQLPEYTTLGYRDKNGNLTNKNNNLKYINSNHLIVGVEYLPNQLSKISIEGFYKAYYNYPFSLTDSIPLADRAVDFGVIGNEPVESTAKGLAYGVELLLQSKIKNKTNLTISYTFAISQFAGPNQSFHSSSWDNRNIFTFSLNRTFNKNWRLGLKWRYAGGLPYTPYDLERSSYIAAWDIKGQPYYDFSEVNDLRFKPFHQLDIRIDKTYYLKKSTLEIYLDIQNLYNFKSQQQDLITNLDPEGNPAIDPTNNQRYVLRALENDGTGTIVPTIGIMFDF